jgi:hypothetical protein
MDTAANLSAAMGLLLNIPFNDTIHRPIRADNPVPGRIRAEFAAFRPSDQYSL